MMKMYERVPTSLSKPQKKKDATNTNDDCKVCLNITIYTYAPLSVPVTIIA